MHRESLPADIHDPAAAGLVSLRHVLLQLVLFAALPIVIVSIGLLVHVIGTQRAAMHASLLDHTRALAQAVDRELAGWKVIADTLASAESLRNDDLRAFHLFAQRVAVQYPGCRIALVDVAGNQLLNTTRPYGTPLPALLPPGGTADDDNGRLWQDAIEHGRPYFSHFFFGALERIPSVAYRTPIVRDGKTRYVLAVVFTTGGLEALLDRERARDESIAAVLDRRGVVTARSVRNEEFRGRPAAQGVLDALATSESGAGETVSREGTRVRFAYTRIPQNGWSVVLAVPTAVADRGIWTSLFVWSGIVIALVGLGVALARRTWKEVAEPLGVLARNAALLERGEPVAMPASRVLEVRDCSRAWALAMSAEQDRRAQERLRLAAEAREREAQQASREKDRVLAALGHELRNPLGAISNSVHVLEAAGPLSPRADAMVVIIKRQALHLTRLVENLLDLARATFGKMQIVREAVDLHALASQTAATYANRHEAAARITVTGSPTWVSGDATRLDQVLRNLLDNAVKFTPATGRIDLVVQREGAQAVLRVRDDGAGIPKELVRELFDPFVQNEQTIDRAQGGLGLGLALVRQIVNLHGGTVDVDSAGEAQGTCVTVRMRCIEGAGSSPAASPAAHALPRRRVLVVEDKDDARASMSALLDTLGQEVRAAPDGRTALALAGLWRPELVFIDIGLPDMDGFELAAKLRRDPQMRALRLFALTGYTHPADRDRAQRAGFDGFIAKPATHAEISAALLT